MSMADRVVLMRNGRVEQAGAPHELYERPASTFVAGFIGTPPMNVVTLAEAPGGAIVAGSDGPVVAREIGGPARAGIRPEHIRLADHGQPAVVEGSEYFGADTIIAARTGTERLLVRIGGRPGVAIGETVRLAWEAGALHLFDASTERRRDSGTALAVGM
jgi:sn-glycerol 3-phosphate transport system ATP-binding protein